MKRKLPPNLSDLRFYLPEFITNQKNALTITHLMIPGPSAPHALRRVLAELMTTLAANLPNDDIIKFIKMAEAQVLETNTKFYRDLQNFLKDRLAASAEKSALKIAIAMTDLQLSKLAEYRPL